MEQTLYIKEWMHKFEYAHAVRGGVVRWRKHPVDHNSPRYRMLMATSNGRDAYCVFLAIVDLVARHRSRGVVVDADQRPLTARVVAAATSIPVSVCIRAFAMLQRPEYGWLTTDAQSVGRAPKGHADATDLPEDGHDLSPTRDNRATDSPQPRHRLATTAPQPRHLEKRREEKRREEYPYSSSDDIAPEVAGVAPSGVPWLDVLESAVLVRFPRSAGYSITQALRREGEPLAQATDDATEFCRLLVAGIPAQVDSPGRWKGLVLSEWRRCLDARCEPWVRQGLPPIETATAGPQQDNAAIVARLREAKS
jgi:hypothetical protein